MGSIEWRWENLQVALGPGQITLAGTLWQQGAPRQIQATLTCQIASKGRLVCSVSPSSSLDVATAETVQVSWKAILTRLLRGRANTQAGDDPREAEKLYQVFDLPSDLGSVETVAQALSVESDWLILHYPLPPLSTRELVVVELDAPEVTITQPDIPTQPASGMPVPIIMQATLTSQSYPPYDYAWRIGRSPLLQPMHTEPVTFTARPGPFHLGSPKARKRKLTTVRLKLIDGLGQVAKAKRPAYYYRPPEPRKPSPPHPSAPPAVAKIVASLATVLVVLALLACGAQFIRPFFDRATITLTPKHGDQGNTFTLTTVLSAPDASKLQVGARFLAAPSQPYTSRAKATGTKIVPATQAQGTLTITLTWGHLDLPIGYQFISNSGVTIATDAEFNETWSGPKIPKDIPAHAVNPGSSGNIQANDIYIINKCYIPTETGCAAVATIQNLSAFVGGTDAHPVHVVAQSDIDNATNGLPQANQPNLQQLLQGQLRPGEQLTGTLQGFSTISADHKVGDIADQVTVTEMVTFVGEAYDQAGALALAAQLLKNQAAQNPGAGYALVGQITTTLVSATPDSQGTVVIQVAAKGRWAYQFSASQQQTLIHLIVGKGKQEAQQLLAKQPGVAEVSIQITGENEQTLPTYPFLIQIEVQAISGL